MKIKEIAEIRKKFNYTHIVVLGITEDNIQHIATHGKTSKDAEESAHMGNQIKKMLTWPEERCYDKPIQRICDNCEYWQSDNYRSGVRIEQDQIGLCMYDPNPVERHKKDLACKNFISKM